MTVISANNLSLIFETNDSTRMGNRLPLVGRQEKQSAAKADPVGVTISHGTAIFLGVRFAHNPHPQSLPTRGREVSRPSIHGERKYLSQVNS